MPDNDRPAISIPSKTDNIGTIEPSGRSEWRSWLEENHAISPGIWLIYLKKMNGRQALTYDEAVEEALCFGWIDSRTGAIDQLRYKQLFTPRRKGSSWSALNKERVAMLIDDGFMAPVGRAKVEEAKRDGSWDLLEKRAQLSIPEDLLVALGDGTAAAHSFQLYGEASKRMLYRWLNAAKRPETRSKRIAEVVALVESGGNLSEFLRTK